MNTRTSHKASALCLRAIDYGDSDRIVTFYTAEMGKVKGIAKGAKRSKKRFANALEPFTLSNLLYSKRGRDTLALIESCDVTEHFPALHQDLEGTLFASYLMDLADQFTLEGKANGELFTTLLEFLFLIESGNRTEGLLRFFEMRLLKHTGYEPVLSHCLSCRRSIDQGGDFHFVPREGGIRCVSCEPAGALSISPGTAKTLLHSRELQPEMLARLSLSAAAAAESRNILTVFIRHLLGKELKSLQVLNEVKRMGI
ncbi:MAG: DNA repair protein RecO [Smithellaceae bacterium]|nr:DNA repair protein RecO [Smithellaceae bacterium]